jgi:hypothetical protein
MVLKDSTGQEHFSHDEMASIIWEAFKERMGTGNLSHIYFNLEDFLQPCSNLDFLALPFTNEEINAVVKNLPSDNSTGPDGFNMDFMKKC